MNWIQSIDWFILIWIQEHLQCGMLNFIMPKISMLGDLGAIWLVAAVVLLFSPEYRKWGIMIIVGIAVGYVIGNLGLKPLIARPRPCWLDQSIQLLIPMETDYSFPSGHTLASVIGAALLTRANLKFGYIAIPLAVLIAFSRLYLYQHFPTDVLASVVLGLLIVSSFFFLSSVMQKNGITV